MLALMFAAWLQVALTEKREKFICQVHSETKD